MAGSPDVEVALMRQVSTLVLNPHVRDVKRRTMLALAVYALIRHGTNKACSLEGMRLEIEKGLGLRNVPMVLLEEAVVDLERQRIVSRASDGFVITPERASPLRTAASESAGLFAVLTDEFLRQVQKYSGKLDDHQRVFAVKAFEGALYGLLKGLAASSAELLTGHGAELADTGVLEALNEALALIKGPLIERPGVIRSAVHQAILDLFSNPSPKFSAGLLHVATNFVMLRVLNLDPDLRRAEAGFFRDARILLDTNVLIGLICQASIRFTHTHWLLEATKGLGVTLVVSDRTLRELATSIRYARDVYQRDHGRAFSAEMASNEIIRTYRQHYSRASWDDFQGHLEETRREIFGKYSIETLGFEISADSRWMMEYRRIIDHETSRLMESRPYDIVDHDAYHLLLIQELRRTKPGSFSSPWFLTYDYKLRRADRAIREVTGVALGSTLSPDTWFEIIYPFLAPDVHATAVAELFVKMLGASLLPLTPVSVKDFLAYVGEELSLDGKDTQAVYKMVEQTHLFQTLQKAVVQSDMPFAFETLFAAIGEAIRKGEESEANRAAVQRLVNRNRELTGRLQELEIDFEIDTTRLRAMLDAADAAQKPAERKKTLEDLGVALCEGVRGWKVVGRDRRTATSELDLIVENSNTTHPFLREMGSDIPVECKNWRDPVGAAEIRDFGNDIRKRRFSFGVLISQSGVTGESKKRSDAVGECWNLFSKDGVSVLVLSKPDVERVVAGASLVAILREKARELKLSG